MTNPNSSQAMQSLRDEEHLILPSLLQCDFGNLEREISRLEAAGIKALHLDVMDGHFVPNLTYGMPIVEGIRRITSLPIDVHLMISDPGQYVRQFADAGADCLTIHAEIDSPCGEILQSIRELGVGAGLALNPATPFEVAEELLPLIDLLLIMSVDAGFGGQSFNPSALEKLRRARNTSDSLLLEVDGGINTSTIAECKKAGAQLFVVGSAIFGQADYGQAIDGLQQALAS